MKHTILLWILLFSASCVYSQKNSSVVTISQVRDGGDGSYYTVIGSDKRKMDDVAKYFKFNEDFTNKFEINENVLSKICNFVRKNCVRKNTITERSSNFFTIRLIENDNTSMCYLENKALSKPYLKQLIDILKKSSCDTTCKKLKSEFEGMLRSLSL